MIRSVGSPSREATGTPLRKWGQVLCKRRQSRAATLAARTTHPNPSRLYSGCASNVARKPPALAASQCHLSARRGIPRLAFDLTRTTGRTAQRRPGPVACDEMERLGGIVLSRPGLAHADSFNGGNFQYYADTVASVHGTEKDARRRCRVTSKPPKLRLRHKLAW